MGARAIVEKFGGTSAAAQAFGTYPAKVSYWKKTDSIPRKHIPVVRAAAWRLGIPLIPADFLPEVAECEFVGCEAA